MAAKLPLKVEADLAKVDAALKTLPYIEGTPAATATDFRKFSEWTQLPFVNPSECKFQSAYPNLARYLLHIHTLSGKRTAATTLFGACSSTGFSTKLTEATGHATTAATTNTKKDAKQVQAERDAKKAEKAAAAAPGKNKEFKKGGNVVGYDVKVVAMQDRTKAMGKAAPPLGVASQNLKTIVHKEPK